jgi:hypothetical protein
MATGEDERRERGEHAFHGASQIFTSFPRHREPFKRLMADVDRQKPVETSLRT